MISSPKKLLVFGIVALLFVGPAAQGVVAEEGGKDKPDVTGLSQRLYSLACPADTNINRFDLMRCDFDNRQGGSFPENALVQQARKHGSTCTVSTKSNAEQLLILQDGRACQLRRGGQRARYLIHHQAGGVEVPLEKFGYGWVKVHLKVGAVLKQKIIGTRRGSKQAFRYPRRYHKRSHHTGKDGSPIWETFAKTVARSAQFFAVF